MATYEAEDEYIAANGATSAMGADAEFVLADAGDATCTAEEAICTAVPGSN